MKVTTDFEPPFDQDCRAEEYLPGFSKCLKQNSICKFFLHFGYGGFCMHPLQKKIVEQTIAAAKAAKTQHGDDPPR